MNADSDPSKNLLPLAPCRARRVADGREGTAGTPRCALRAPTKRPRDRTLAGNPGIRTPRTLACTGSLDVPPRVLLMTCRPSSTMRNRLFSGKRETVTCVSSLSASSVNSDSLLTTLSMSCRKLGSFSTLERCVSPVAFLTHTVRRCLLTPLASQTLLSFALPAPRCGALQPAAAACSSDRRF